MSRRSWVKLFCSRWLQGSIRGESIELRAIFIDLMAMAGDSIHGYEGRIQLAEGVGFNDECISGLLNVPLDVWKIVKVRLSNHPDKRENRIKLLPAKSGYFIQILSWDKYQSEYQRNKKYKSGSKKSSTEGSNASSTEGSSIDSEERRERQKKDIKKQKRKAVTASAPPTIADLIEEFKASGAYPGVDIEQEAKKAALWLKGPKGKGRRFTWKFFFNWLGRAEPTISEDGSDQMPGNGKNCEAVARAEQRKKEWDKRQRDDCPALIGKYPWLMTPEEFAEYEAKY